METKLNITLFGPLQIEQNGHLHHLPRRKAQALLAILAITDQPYTRDTLATLLWPNTNNSRSQLRRRLADLKKALGDGWFATTRDTIHLPNSPNLWVDARHFHQQHQKSQTAVCANAIPALIQAMTLYKDHFLTGFHLNHCPTFAEWHTIQTTTWQQHLNQVAQTLCDCYQEGHQFDSIIATTQRWLTLTPLHEPALHHHLQALLATGQTAVATQQYQQYCQQLQEEVGVSPSDQLVTFMQERGVLHRSTTTSSTAITTKPSAPRTLPPNKPLPHMSTPFVGRISLQQQIHHHLTNAQTQLITLTGVGGIGKTSLALTIAHHHQQQGTFTDGIYFVSLVGITETGQAIAAIAEQLDFAFYQGSQPSQQLQAYLQPKKLLLILDNGEPSLTNPNMQAFLLTLLQTAVSLTLLVTSRQRLQLSGEVTFTLDGLTETESQRLFQQNAQRLQPTFALTHAHKTAVNHITQLVHGLPLGIELAATWIDMLTPAEIANEISTSLDFLETIWHGVPERHRSLRAIFDTTYALLPPASQQLLTDLSIFQNGFTRQAAQAVTGATLRQLAQLRQHTLLQYDHASQRYALHELIRQFASEQLDETPSHAQTIQAKHAAHFAHLLQEQLQSIQGQAQQTAVALIEADLENIQFAWAWAISQQQINLLHPFIDTLWYFYQIQSRFDEAQTLLAMLPTPQSTDLTPQVQLILAKGFSFLTYFAGVIGLVELSTQALSHAEALTAVASIRQQMGVSLTLLGLTQNILGHTDKGQQTCQQSLEFAQKTNDPWQLAVTLSILAGNQWLQGNLTVGLDYLTQSAHLYQKTDDQWGLTHCYHLQAELLLSQNEYTHAQPVYQDTLHLAKRINDAHKIMKIHFRLGEIAQKQQKVKTAAYHYKRSLATAVRLGHDDGKTQAITALTQLNNA